MLYVDGPAGKYIDVAIHVPKLNHPVREQRKLYLKAVSMHVLFIYSYISLSSHLCEIVFKQEKMIFSWFKSVCRQML